MAVVRQLAQSAVQEYGAAVAEGRVVELIEYQDARGFLLQAQRQLDALPNRPLAMQKTIAAMLQAFPTALAPQRSLRSPEQLQALQAQL